MWKSFARSSVRPVLASLAFLAVASYAPAAAHGDGPLPDPFTGEWLVSAVPDAESVADGQGAFDEALLFHNGQFSAAVFAMFGFVPAPYTIALDDFGVTSFSATLASADRGTLAWTGYQTPTGLSGQLVWARPDGQHAVYQISAERPQDEVAEQD